MTDLSLLEEFIVESNEHLDEMEASLLRLEKESDDTSIYDDLFRNTHSIKGGAQYLELDRVSTLSHAMENLLDVLREGSKKSTDEDVEILISGRDLLENLLKELEIEQVEKSSIDELIAQLSEVLSEKSDTGLAEQDNESEVMAAQDGQVFPQFEITETESDKDLFKVFIDNMTEKYTALKTILDDVDAVLDEDAVTQSKTYLENLKSSARYMSYDDMTAFFDSWLDSMSDKDETGTNVTADFMSARLNHIATVLPENVSGKDEQQLTEQISELQSDDAVLESTISSSDKDDLPAEEESNDIDVDLLPDFLAESYEHIEEAESLLLSLEQAPDDVDIMNAIFRVFHTIKGGAQFVGLVRVSKLAHRMEDLLGLLRSGQRKSSTEVVDIFIEGRDRIYQLLTELEAQEKEISPINDLIRLLEQRIEEGDHVLESALLSSDIDDLPAEEESNDIDVDSLPDFLAESYEHIEEAESLLLSLEQAPDDVDIMNAIFRVFHTIKGGAQFVGLVRVSKLAHRMEDLLGLLRSGQRKSSTEVVDIFIEARDRVHQLLTELEEKEKEISPINDLIRLLEQQIEENEPAAVYDDMAADPASDSTEELGLQKNVAQEMTSDITHQTDLSETVTSADPAYEVEEQDKELFDIYVHHHHDQLVKLKECLNNAASFDSDELLHKFSEMVSKMCNSASYMGYDELVYFFVQWQESISQQLTAVQNDAAVDYEFMHSYIERVSGMLPKHDVNVVEQQLSLQAVDDTVSSDRNEKEVEEHDPEDVLLDRLSDALNCSANYTAESESIETLHEVLDEILHVHDEDATAKSNNNDSVSAVEGTTKSKITDVDDKKTDKTTAKTADKSAIADAKTTERRPVAVKGKSGFKKSVRVDAEKIDLLMNQVGELVVDRSYFFQLFNEMRELQAYFKDNVGLEQKDMKQVRSYLFKLSEAIASLNRTSNELQEGVMKIRMLPISQLFNRYPRLVHDLTRKSKKKVNLEVRGEETELDKMVVEELSDPLVHMIRNAIDHGIESPEERKTAGKPETGTLLLDAYQESNHIVIEVTDDGKGIDTQRIREKAIEKGHYTEKELDRMTEKDLIWLIMSAGFSTAAAISDTSGRGVGMDVVKKNIEKLNGVMEIESIAGKETKIRIKIPLTLAIIAALQVQVEQSLFTIPLANVEETLKIESSDTTLIEGTEIIHLRGQTLPIVRLSSLFNLDSSNYQDEFFVVVANAGSTKIGLVVDELVGQREVVIKPLVDYLQVKSGFSGATILGDGNISLILDIYELLNMTSQKQKLRNKGHHRIVSSVEVADSNRLH